MKQAVIDIGSNSMRLTVYEISDESFKILFREKNMAGLAGYIESGALSDDGIKCAYNGLLDFKDTMDSLGINHARVFATASLRNIRNTQEALATIRAATGYQVEIISGEDEALFGYIGAMRELHLTKGAFLDIGGASTEVAVFFQGAVRAAASFPIGSLSLYRECVKKITPGESALKRIRGAISTELEEQKLFKFDKQSSLACVGGTARAALKVAKKVCGLPSECRSMTGAQLEEVCMLLCKGDKAAVRLILNLEPDRIHTMVPGIMIMNHVSKLFQADEIVISKFGVREGYLCQRILQSGVKNIYTPKTGN